MLFILRSEVGNLIWHKTNNKDFQLNNETLLKSSENKLVCFMVFSHFLLLALCSIKLYFNWKINAQKPLNFISIEVLRTRASSFSLWQNKVLRCCTKSEWFISYKKEKILPLRMENLFSFQFSKFTEYLLHSMEYIYKDTRKV